MVGWASGKDMGFGVGRSEFQVLVLPHRHHRLDGHEFEQAPAVGDRQGSLAYCTAWGCKDSDTTEGLN